MHAVTHDWAHRTVHERLQGAQSSAGQGGSAGQVAEGIQQSNLNRAVRALTSSAHARTRSQLVLLGRSAGDDEPAVSFFHPGAPRRAEQAHALRQPLSVAVLGGYAHL